MALLEVPTRNDLPSYSYVITLDGKNYTLSFKFNSRMQKWFVSIGDGTNNPLVNQVPVIVGFPLFDRYVEQAVPPGNLFPWDTSGQGLDPGRFDLGDRVRIFYLEVGTPLP